MSDAALQHTHLDGVADYTEALDTLCRLAQHTLYLFEDNFENLGFNGEARHDILRHFLLASPAHRLYVLAHDTQYLSTRCPRMMTLLTQYGDRMSIRRLDTGLRHITEPFSIADDEHYVRRFHFDDPRGILGQNDPEQARALKSRFLEMWTASHTALSATRLGL